MSVVLTTLLIAVAEGIPVLMTLLDTAMSHASAKGNREATENARLLMDKLSNIQRKNNLKMEDVIKFQNIAQSALSLYRGISNMSQIDTYYKKASDMAKKLSKEITESQGKVDKMTTAINLASTPTYGFVKPSLASNSVFTEMSNQIDQIEKGG